MVILDTCALIELCLEEPGLKAQTLKRIQEGSEVLSVSFAEIALKLKKGALELNLTAKDLLDKADIVVTPGNGFGESGEGYIRMAITVDKKRLAEAVDRIKKRL